MIKKLLLTAALLAPGLAYGQVSAPLDLPVTPAGQNPTPPPQAAAAGFTALALNADFTSPAYSNPATFVNACGATATARWYLTFPVNTTAELPCSDVAIVSDGSLPQVLQVTLPTSTWQGGDEAHSTVSFQYGGYSFNASQPCVIVTAGCLPNEGYIEYVFRTDHASWDQDGTHGDHIGEWYIGRGVKPDHTYPPNNWVEIDFLETAGTSSGAGSCGAAPCLGGGIIDWGGSGNGPVTWTTLDITSYHKIGVLITSDEATNIYKCTFVDDVFQGCVHMALTAVSYSQHDNELSLAYLGTFSSSVAPINPIRGWYQYARVWTCSNWQTQTCPGTMVTHWPFP